MNTTLKIGILGCGDFLRTQADGLKQSRSIAVKALYDPDFTRAERYASEIGGVSVQSDSAIFDDPEIAIICLFTPPGIRRELIECAAEAGKHILTTKPLGPSTADCAAMVKAVSNKIRGGVIYSRTGNAGVEMYRRIFDSGEIGSLTLFKEDWLHHYPEWNKWALDPEENGGPFMDAMIHNLNIARYLMQRKPTKCTFFSENHSHPSLSCNDTEFLKLDFEGGGAAYLFITWAADLAVYSKEGNYREHIEIRYMITDSGWRLTDAWDNDKLVITASRDGKTRQWATEPFMVTLYDAFAEAVTTGKPLRSDIPDICEAYEDIKLLRDSEKHIGKRMQVDLSL